MAGESTVEERLARLESAVAELQRALVSTGAGAAGGGGRAAPESRLAPASRPAAAPASAAAQAGAAKAPPSPPRDWVAVGQLWIGRAGLGILALGLAFLFHYAVVRGWLTPQLRVALGLLIGAGLLTWGLRLHGASGAPASPGTPGAPGANRAYGLLLLGGGVGVLYLSAFAAFGFYRLVPAALALVGLAALTLLAVRLAANREEALLAHLGALGAFAAPVLVRGPQPSLLLLSGYVVLVVAWTGWTAVREGWRLLAWTAAAGALLLLLLGEAGARTQSDRVLLAAAAVLSGAGLMAGLLWRQRAGAAAGPRWKLRAANRYFSLTPEELDLRSAAALAAVLGLFVPVFVASALLRPEPLGGGLMVGVAVALGACAWLWRDQPALARALAVAAAVPLLVGTALLDLHAFRAAFALEALALLLVGRRAGVPPLTGLGHVAFALVAAMFAALVARAGRPVAPAILATDLMAIAAAFYATTVLPGPPATRSYGVAGLLGLLGWLLVALLPLAGGQYWVSIAWGALGSGLLLGAWWRPDVRLRVAALIVLAAVALKLLFVDTARLPAGGRVVVFLGFGALFLALGPLFRRGAPAASGAPAPPGAGPRP